jgi:glycosyltransferase involved in cell wall biosynthesis
MRVVQIAPPWFPIPPAGYGGIERVVYDLTEGLVAAGCDVALCAPAGSRSSARLLSTVPRGVGLNMTEAQKHRHLLDASRVAYRQALEAGADIIHDHTDAQPPHGFPIPIVRTIHGPVTPAILKRYRQLSRRGDRFVAISHRQHDLFAAAAEATFGAREQIAFAGVVYNPLDVTATRFYPANEKRGYLAFLGRCHWEKGPDAAIRVAQSADVPLMMALRVTTEEQPYFEAVIRPLVLSIKNLAKFVGEVDGQEKDELIGHAGAVLFPSPWEEPFGLVMAEALARGTPVIALARGAAPELIIDGETGVLCADEDEMVCAVPRAMALDPQACRAQAERLFDREQIARQYMEIYETVLAESAHARAS